jgi:hypothetical protein
MPITVTTDGAQLIAATPSVTRQPTVVYPDPLTIGDLKFRRIQMRLGHGIGDVVRLASDMPRCILLGLSTVVRTGATISGLLLDIGYQDFIGSDGKTVTAGVVDGIAAGLDIAAAGLDPLLQTSFTQLIDAHTRWDLLVRIRGAALPANSVVDICLVYAEQTC